MQLEATKENQAEKVKDLERRQNELLEKHEKMTKWVLGFDSSVKTTTIYIKTIQSKNEQLTEANASLKKSRRMERL